MTSSVGRHAALQGGFTSEPSRSTAIQFALPTGRTQTSTLVLPEIGATSTRKLLADTPWSTGAPGAGRRNDESFKGALTGENSPQPDAVLHLAEASYRSVDVIPG